MAVWTNKAAGLGTGVTVVCMVLWLCSCGGSMSDGAGLPDGDAARSTARSMGLAEALAETEAMQAPAGVDVEEFGELQAELMRVLQEQGTERFISSAPTSQASAVNDLMITHNPDGSADLAWTYKNQGDGDLNSEVNIADLTPMGIHLGKNGQSADWFKARNTDNDRNLEVNISDITPIGSNFLTKLEGYWLQRAVAVDSTWNPVSQIAFDTSAVNSENAQREFSFHLNVPADGNFYRVAPYEGGNIGIPSNAVQAESFVLEGRPGNVSATQGTVFAAVELSWVGIVEVDYYEIHRRAGAIGAFEPLVETPDSTAGYIDTNVVSGTHYTYIVRGWKGDKKTDFSLQFEGWPLEIPLTPQNLAASDGTSDLHVTLNWESVEHADEYVIYRSLEEAGTYAEIARTDQLSYDDTTAAPLDLNWYYVTASNQAGESPQSNKDSGYLDGALPVIESVSPLGGLTGDDLQMLALTTGAAPLSWSWNFGVAATPATSSDASPLITLAEPGVYDCSLTVEGSFDNDVFNFQLTVTTDEWVHTLGGPQADEGFSVGADADGNVYVIGKTDYPTVAKFTAAGEVEWARKYETAARDFDVISGSVDVNGNVFVATGPGDHGSGSIQGEGVLVFALDTDGALIYEKFIADSGGLTTFHHPRTAVDGTGNFYVVFSMWDEVELGLTNMVVYKFQPNGQVAWSSFYEASFLDLVHARKHAEGFAADSSGNIYIAGNEACVIKISNSGAVDWCKGWGDVDNSPHEHGYSVAVDGNGDIFLGGGANTLGDYQPFIVKFQSDGIVLWQKGFSVFTGASSGHITRMYVDQSGNVYALNPHREDEGLNAASRFYAIDSSGITIGTWEYTPRSSNELLDLHVSGSRILLAGTASNEDGTWASIAETQADFALSFEDRTVNIAPSSGSVADNDDGDLVPYTDYVLDSGDGSTDVLVMKLNVDSLPN